MAVETVKNNNAMMAQDLMMAKTQNKPNNDQQTQQLQQAQQQNQQPEDRVTLNSRQNNASGGLNPNPALGVPGESQRPRGAEKSMETNQNNNNNIVAQMINEAANRTSSMQQANNAYNNPNKPTQTQNQINYTV